MNWWGSTGYRIWVVGGLFVIVGVGVGLGLANPADQRVIFAILPLLAIYMGGIFVMQGRAARRSATADVPGEAQSEEPVTADEPLTRRAELARALALKPINPGAQRAARKASGGVWLSQVVSAAVLTAMILIGVGLYYGGVDETLYPLSDTGPGIPVVFVPIFAMIAFLVLRIPFTIGRSIEASNMQLEPLGLALTETPRIGVRPRWAGSGLQTDVRGPSVITGRRYGRPVRIEMDAKRFETRVATRSPTFSVRSRDRRLEPAGDAPAGVREVLSVLGPAARWRGVTVEAGEEGIVVSRRGGATAASEQRWMAALWLAERLADAITERA
jgi:hypothetical protein